MVFVVLEIQSNNETAATLINSYIDRNEAESKFHQILGAAAISTVPIHSAVIITDTGVMLKNETYRHDLINNIPDTE